MSWKLYCGLIPLELISIQAKRAKWIGSDLRGPWAGWRRSTCDDNVENVGFVS